MSTSTRCDACGRRAEGYEDVGEWHDVDGSTYCPGCVCPGCDRRVLEKRSRSEDEDPGPGAVYVHAYHVEIVDGERVRTNTDYCFFGHDGGGEVVRPDGVEA